MQCLGQWLAVTSWSAEVNHPLDAGGAAGAELDPDFGLRLRARLADRLGQAHGVVHGKRDEAARERRSTLQAAPVRM